jgi:DUF1009 family protein
MARIGLVAGGGALPILFSRLAKDRGDTVIAFGLKGVTDASLENHVHKLHWLDWGSLQKGLLLLATERIRKIILLGKLNKDLFFKGEERFDGQAKKILDRIGDRKDSVLFDEVAKIFGKLGVEVLDSTIYFQEYIPTKGVLTNRQPTPQEWDDINYGMDVARSLSGFDIGQTVAVKNKTVIAIEAVEGTDETIARAGRLVHGGFSVVKMARPNQDMKFDVPLVGSETLGKVIASGANILALEGLKTLLIDREETVRLANERNISIVVV